MAIKKVLVIPDPTLYKRSEEVVKFDKTLRNLVRDMFDSMYGASGVGLSAVQIGILQRVVTIDLMETHALKGVFINPQLIESSEEMQEEDEGCLSVPGLYLPLQRPRKVKVKYQNLSGHIQTIKAEDLAARALLHEMDHLDGKVFVDLLEPDIRKNAQADIELVKQGKLPKSAQSSSF